MLNGMRLLVLAALASAAPAGLPAADPAADPRATIVSVSDLECAGCAKKVVARVSEVAGVAKAEADVEAKVVKVTPKPGLNPSPKLLWEAVEKAGKTPAKVQGPSGTFTDKPNV